MPGTPWNPQESGGSRRKQRLESFLKREIATCVSTELRDPRLGFITISRVVMSPDLSQVTAYFTLLEGQKREHLAAQALDRARAYIQRSYAKHLRLRRLPTLLFAYDTGAQKQQELEALIRAARATDPNPGEAASPPPVQDPDEDD